MTTRCVECGGSGTIALLLTSGEPARVECWACFGSGTEAAS